MPSSPPSSPEPGPARAAVRRIGLFVLVGGASAAVDFVVFLGLTHIGLVAWAGSAVSFLVAFAVNYRGNRDLVFRAGAVPGALRRYVVLVAFNWVASTGLVALGTAVGLPGWAAKLVSMVLIAAFNFAALRAWVFKRR
ncbi:MAG: GtrA family protein [Bifidobacteriaceae bacterium]|jgi:putative flippase GtrA|nr:GtrA family protein [Bifidobacteriaceae bacterium]